MALLRTVLVADDEPSIRHVLTVFLGDHGYEVRAVADGAEALKELAARHYDVLVCDVRMPKLDGMALLPKALELLPDLTTVVMSAYGNPDAALQAVAAGAYGYVQKPFKPEELVLVLRKADERQRLLRENRRLREGAPDHAPSRILGQAPGIQALHKQIEKLAPVGTTVLITGESGTGKELVAREIHDRSPRAKMPFVAVNCGAIPAGLLESELFGHARGAFTDAKAAKRGLFSEADGGTLFLDEIGELPMAAQVKLLRFLQEGEIRPVGENRAEKVEVRVLAATLRDLAKAVERGEFREDLYYRLNVVQLRVPPLRERMQDLGLLATHFIGRFNRALNRDPPIRGLTADAETALQGYGWPGNVRELENAIERGVLLSDGSELTVDSLPEKIWQVDTLRSDKRRTPPGDEGSLSLKRAVRELEESYIKAALRRTRGNRTRAAELLEISHRALLYKIKEFAIDPDAEAEQGED